MVVSYASRLKGVKEKGGSSRVPSAYQHFSISIAAIGFPATCSTTTRQINCASLTRIPWIML